MKQIEVTLKIKDDLDKCKEILINKGYNIVKHSQIDDIYMTQKKQEITLENIDEILKKCVLLRYLNENDNIYKKITYKKKEYDSQNNILSEKKINISCEDLDKAKQLFIELEFEELVRVKYKALVFEKDKIQYALQEVEGLGLLLECESEKDFEGSTQEQIIKEKKKIIEKILNDGLNIEKEVDIKKAYELIRISLNKN